MHVCPAPSSQEPPAHGHCSLPAEASGLGVIHTHLRLHNPPNPLLSALPGRAPPASNAAVLTALRANYTGSRAEVVNTQVKSITSWPLFC